MALALAEELGPVLRLKNPVQELTLERVSSDELGMTHIRMQQQYHGVPVWGAQISIHFDRNSDPFLLTGVYTPTPDLPVLQQEITAEAAVAVARKYGSILQSQEKDLTPPAAKRMVYWDLDRSPELCWNVDLNPDNSHALEIFVSAATGSVIHQYDKLRTEAAVGTAADLKGNTLQFPCWSEQGQYYAINTTLPMYNTITSKPPNILKLRGAMYLLDFANQDPNKSYVMNDIKTSNLTTWDPAAVSLMQNMMLIENYYRSTFNLNSLDNAGMNIWAVIHWRWVTAGGGSTSENASWNPTVRCMQFGDGEQIAAGQLPHSLDIVAHEYTHGVTNFAANLIYENQPGALDESLSDFFACMVDRDEWLIGDGVTIYQGKKAMRDIANPRNPDVVYSLPMDMTEYLNKSVNDDHGGVHYNMSICARAGYLLCEDIGKDKGEKIFHRARMFYLTQRSQFSDFRAACLVAAKDLFGEGSTEQKAVEKAFDTIGVVASAPAAASTPGLPATGDDAIVFLQTYENAEYDQYHDANFAQLYIQKNGIRSLVTPKIVGNTIPAVSGDGKMILFVGQDNNIYATDGVTEQALTQNGIIRTIAMTKDKRIIAYTTINFDNNIFYINTLTNQVTSAKLTVPVKDASPFDLKYADVLSFNFRGDHLYFDAVSELQLASKESILSWGIYGMRLADDWTFMVVAQSADEQMGNPVMANTQDSLMLADRIVFEDSVKYHLEAVSIDFNKGNLGTACQRVKPVWAAIVQCR